MRTIVKRGAVAALSLAVMASAAFAENVKIAFIDPLSGPFASTGTNGLHQYEFAAETLVNANGGVLGGQKFEIVGFDNKISPKESLIQLQVAIDQGIRYVAQGNSSGVANALTEAIDKHNRRNPDSRVLFLNYSAVDPALTNEKCNFWHFRFDANGACFDGLGLPAAGERDLRGFGCAIGAKKLLSAVCVFKEERVAVWCEQGGNIPDQQPSRCEVDAD